MHPMLRTLWLAIHHHRCPVGRAGPVGHPLGVLLGLGLLLVGCNNSGNQGRLAPQSGPTPALERQAVDNLLTLYRTALRQADIDRVDALLQPTAPSAPVDAIVAQRAQQQAEDGAVMDVQALRATLTRTFHTRTVTALDILADTIQVAPDSRSVTFLEVESTEDPVTLVQQTRLFHTTWGLTQDEVDGTVTVRIGAVQREGPLVQVTTLGQVQARALTRVAVRGTGAPFALAGVEVTVPETGAAQALMAADDAWVGVFTPPLQPSPQPLRVQLRGLGGEALVLQHPYRLRVPGEGVVTRVAGTEATRVFTVTVAPDGTVWAGGDGGATLYQVPPGATRATQVGRLLAHPDGRVEAVAVDQLGRLHVLVVDLDDTGVVGHGDIIHDPAYPGVFCQTVNLADTAYPFRDPHGQPSASTRALAAGGGDIWLFGSDGGVARVQDSFRGGQCPAQGLTVRYDPVLQRATGALPTNTVPVLVAEEDGTLWLGTALGLTRLQQGHFTPVPFERTLTVPGDVATLEAFFQAVAQALFAAQPLTTVAVGGVSFVEQFGRPLVKEDLIFSAVAVAPGQLWVGTLGGGLRRIDGRGVSPQEFWHLTQLDGLSSNLIVALAVSPDGALWAATDKGVSRLREADGGSPNDLCGPGWAGAASARCGGGRSGDGMAGHRRGAVSHRAAGGHDTGPGGRSCLPAGRGSRCDAPGYTVSCSDGCHGTFCAAEPPAGAPVPAGGRPPGRGWLVQRGLACHHGARRGDTDAGGDRAEAPGAGGAACTHRGVRGWANGGGGDEAGRAPGRHGGAGWGHASAGIPSDVYRHNGSGHAHARPDSADGCPGPRVSDPKVGHPGR